MYVKIKFDIYVKENCKLAFCSNKIIFEKLCIAEF